MNRRIREVLAVRRSLAATRPTPASAEPTDVRDAEPLGH